MTVFLVCLILFVFLVLVFPCLSPNVLFCQVLLALAAPALRQRPARRALPVAPVAVALGGAVLVAAAATVTSRSKPEPKDHGIPKEVAEQAGPSAEELRGSEVEVRQVLSSLFQTRFFVWRLILVIF